MGMPPRLLFNLPLIMLTDVKLIKTNQIARDSNCLSHNDQCKCLDTKVHRTIQLISISRVERSFTHMFVASIAAGIANTGAILPDVRQVSGSVIAFSNVKK